MATITKREGKGGVSYRIRVSVGRDAQDKQIFVSTTYKPKATTKKAIEREVALYADEYEQKVRTGRSYEADKTTFAEFIPVWRDNWGKDHLTQSVLEGYISILEYRVLPALGSVKLSKVNAVMIENVLADMRAQKKAIKTIKRTFTAINSVFRYAYRKGVIEENPCQRVELPSERVEKMEKAERASEIRCFNLEQSKAFLAALHGPFPRTAAARVVTNAHGKTYEVSGYTYDVMLPQIEIAFFTLALYSGARRGELCALTWNDIDFKHHTLTINKATARTSDGFVIKSPKTEAGYRTISLPTVVFDELHRWRGEQTEKILALGTYWKGERGKGGLIFTQEDGRMRSPESFYNRFLSIIRSYNEGIDKKIAEGTARAEDKLPEIRLHDLRHSSASILIASGMDAVTVAHRLGHSDVATTLNTYAHAFRTADEEAANKLERLLG